jgi:hypothetical protein
MRMITTPNVQEELEGLNRERKMMKTLNPELRSSLFILRLWV